MESFWTSIKPINGLRHFVLVNQIKEKDQIDVVMVSVIDVEISLKISKVELINSENWKEGWLILPKIESITKDYLEYKLSKNLREKNHKVFLNKDSLFNIS